MPHCRVIVLFFLILSVRERLNAQIEIPKYHAMQFGIGESHVPTDVYSKLVEIL